MEITKLSTKGQIIIPEIFRRGLDVGTSFTVVKQGDLIVLKSISGLTPEEEHEIIELEKIWNDINSGKGIKSTKDDFFKKMDSW